MALINVREVYPGVLLGLWQTSESTDQFFGNYPFLGAFREHVGKTFKSEERRREFLAVHALLHEMLGIAGNSTKKQATDGAAAESCMPMIGHTAAGKPVLDGYHVGVTHTNGYAALMLSKTCEVACDIEYMSDRVTRIKSKFMRADEHADSLDQLLVCWCGKETVYKLFSDDNLQFAHMRVKPFDAMTDWACEIENLKRGVVQRVDFELTMQFVLTYTFLRQPQATASAQPKKQQSTRHFKKPKQKKQSDITATRQETSHKRHQGKPHGKSAVKTRTGTPEADGR